MSNKRRLSPEAVDADQVDAVEAVEEQVIPSGLPKVRSMTYGQMKEFRASGFDPIHSGGEIGPAVFDWILEKVYGDVEFADDMEYCKLIWLARQTFFASYAMPYEREYAIKNS